VTDDSHHLAPNHTYILFFMLTDGHRVPDEHGVNPIDSGVDLAPTAEYIGEIVERATSESTDERYSNFRAVEMALRDRDPELPEQAVLIRDESGRRYAVDPGDTIGRTDADEVAASIVIDDDAEYTGAVHARFDLTSQSQWLLRDRSVNGTYVKDGSEWQYVLSEGGRKRLQEKGRDPTDERGNIPPEEHPLRDGARIRLVHPTYEVTFEVRCSE
jgi:hypothetical protein